MNESWDLEDWFSGLSSLTMSLLLFRLLLVKEYLNNLKLYEADRKHLYSLYRAKGWDIKVLNTC